MEEKITSFLKFIKREINSGIVLLIMTILALISANSPLAETYFNIFEKTILSVDFAFWKLSKPLYYWINDGLMAIFFLLVGLEVKREILIGELSNFKKALLPLVAALGGVLVPVIIFLIFNFDNPEYKNGWAVPMATDIAFAVGILAILKDKVSTELKIFLTSLAVVDDIAAVIAIAFFYTSDISFSYLTIAFAAWGFLFLLNKLRVRHIWIFLVIGVLFIWYPILKSGVHATVAGVMIAFTIPLKREYLLGTFVAKVNKRLKVFDGLSLDKKYTLTDETYDAIEDIKEACEQVGSPLQNLEHAIHNVTLYGIIPLFTFANTGIRFESLNFGYLMSSNLVWGIFLGLLVGKALGIGSFVMLAKKIKLVTLPAKMSFRDILGAGFLAGIGFTMSIFITDLSFSDNELITTSKIAIFGASLLSGISGFVILKFRNTKNG